MNQGIRMDASSISKMNDMVKNLTKHGIISNSEEAMKMAEKMYNVGKSETKSSDDDEQGKEIEKECSDKSDNNKQEIQNLINQKATQLIDENNKAIILEFQKVWERLNKIMPDIESKLADIKQNIQISASDAGQKSTEEKTEAKEANVDGGVKSNDVSDISVEKFFYCGQK
ncbi:MAG: hypothetical protein U9R34_06405 [Nanoarchaeota archaeon]|nr:hypothetical protein [Nanoarchaeota archaeon]